MQLLNLEFPIFLFFNPIQTLDIHIRTSQYDNDALSWLLFILSLFYWTYLSYHSQVGCNLKGNSSQKDQKVFLFFSHGNFPTLYTHFSKCFNVIILLFHLFFSKRFFNLKLRAWCIWQKHDMRRNVCECVWEETLYDI